MCLQTINRADVQESGRGAIVEHLTADHEVASSNPADGPIFCTMIIIRNVVVTVNYAERLHF